MAFSLFLFCSFWSHWTHFHCKHLSHADPMNVSEKLILIRTTTCSYRPLFSVERHKEKRVKVQQVHWIKYQYFTALMQAFFFWLTKEGTKETKLSWNHLKCKRHRIAGHELWRTDEKLVQAGFSGFLCSQLLFDGGTKFYIDVLGIEQKRNPTNPKQAKEPKRCCV